MIPNPAHSSEPGPQAPLFQSNSTPEFTPRAAPTPAAFRWVLLLSTLAALIPTLWPTLDLRAARLFADPTAPLHALHWWWIAFINEDVPFIFRIALVLASVALLVTLRRAHWARWRFALAFFLIAGVVGPGAVVNLGFKDNWQRARPYQVQNFGGSQLFTRAAVITDQCDNNCSFCSGHVACGVFLASLALIYPRRQWRWAALGVGSGLLIGFARMADMAHWLSDVLWAFPITLTVSWLVWKCMLWLYNRPSRTVG